MRKRDPSEIIKLCAGSNRDSNFSCSRGQENSKLPSWRGHIQDFRVKVPYFLSSEYRGLNI